MELIKITDLTELMGISSRSLRYWEQVGLIESVRPPFEKYRFYDAKNIERLEQIVVLRKMRIPIRDILRIYESQDMRALVEAFVERINAIDKEIETLSELRRIIDEFLQTMRKNGIRKISALPLIWEQIDKHPATRGHGPAGYRELAALSERLSGAPDIGIEELPPMRVVSSFLKEDAQRSDADGFWRWAQANGLAPGATGRHQRFEFQSEDTAVMLKAADGFRNDGPYLDYIFEGGLFATISLYLDEDMGEHHRALIGSLDDNKYYEVDYLHDGSLRHPTLMETLISPDDQRERVALLVPVKRRVADPAHYQKSAVADHIGVEELEAQNPILRAHDIPPRELTPILDPHFKILENGEAEFIPYISKRWLSTDIPVRIPFRVDIEFKTEQARLRLFHERAEVIVNMTGNSSDHTDTDYLFVKEPVFSNDFQHLKIPRKGRIDKNRYNRVTWIVGEKQFALIVNGQMRYCALNCPYMSLDLERLDAAPVVIASDHSEPMYIKSVRVSELAQTRKTKIKAGDLNVITERSNNILPDIHPLVTWHFGENYPFNGCMKFLMERVDGNKAYGYNFFAGIGGDNLVQVYGHDYEKHNDCVSVVWPGPAFVGRVFDEIGYEHAYVTAAQINANKRMYIETLKAYIDNGVPVLIKGTGANSGNSNYQVFVGYEEKGAVLLYLDGDTAEPFKLNASDEICGDWVFIGSKKQEIDFARTTRRALENALELLTSPKLHDCSYGAQAFLDWARDIENGRFDGIEPARFDQWRDHTIYVCNLATNSCDITHDFLQRTKALNPEFRFIDEIGAQYKRIARLWNELEALGGGFNVTLQILQDGQRRGPIADKIREFAPCMEEISLILHENLKMHAGEAAEK